MSKILFVDLETTGVMHWKNGIHQLSGCIEIEGEVKETFNFNIKPYPKAIIEQSSLDVAGVTLEQILTYPEMKDVHFEFCKMLSKYVDKFQKKDKFFLCGYNNASFDNQLLRAFFVQNLDNYFGSWFWSNLIDVMVLASMYLKDKRQNMEDFKLKTVAKHCGIAVDDTKLYDAFYDIELTRAIYQICTNQPLTAAKAA